MDDALPKTYPGATASPQELLRLAQTYRQAAIQLNQLYAPGVPMSLAPMRLCAFHSVELFLAAYLREQGMLPTEVRAFRHDTAQMAGEAQKRGLGLKRKVQIRLQRVSDKREYLVSRYDPQQLRLLEANAIFATLDELEKKVSGALKWKRAPEGALRDDHAAAVTRPASPSPPA
jgi:hypothetical protein